MFKEYETVSAIKRDPTTFKMLMLRELRPDLAERVWAGTLELRDAIGVMKRQMRSSR